jgi:hypothetical protein
MNNEGINSKNEAFVLYNQSPFSINQQTKNNLSIFNKKSLNFENKEPEMKSQIVNFQNLHTFMDHSESNFNNKEHSLIKNRNFNNFFTGICV